MSAPERIWAYHNGNSPTYLTAPDKFHNVEYVRADLVAFTVDENIRLERDLITLAKRLDEAESAQRQAATVAADEANRADAAEAALAERTKERDRARNDEWLAAISAVQYMEANWYQDCRSEVERSALERVAKDFVDELWSTGPTEYLDMKWKDAQRAAEAERRVEAMAEAGWLLLSEIDAGNGAEDIKGATGPLRSALAALAGKD